MSKQDYGDKFGDHLIEEYKAYVQDVGNIGSRNADTNKFYISVLSALLVFLSLTSKDQLLGHIDNLAQAAVALLSILLCFAWWLNIKSYGKLYKAKFDVLRDMEKQLPYQCYLKEWELLGREPEKKQAGEKRKYIFLTSIERAVPLLLAVPFIVIFIFALWKFRG